MMANAIARVSSIGPGTAGTFEVLYQVTYSGTDVPDGTQPRDVLAILNGTASPQVLRQTISDAIAADALASGLTVLPSNMIIPEFQKGV